MREVELLKGLFQAKKKKDFCMSNNLELGLDFFFPSVYPQN